MPQDPLWAPWRLDYIKNSKRDEPAGCFLCRYRDADEDAANFVVARGEHALVVLNRFPYNNGHMLIAPLTHKASLEELTDDELLDCSRQMRTLVGVLKKILNAEGFNIGLNLGQVAGAGLPGHLHWHIVPRWNGDSNYMTVIADVNVIPQSLAALYAAVRGELDNG